MRRGLGKRAIGDAVRRQLLLAALLFLTAGSLRFWEGWVYWILITGAVLFNVLYFLHHDPALVKRRIKVGPTAERQKSQQVIQAVAGTLVCAVIVLAGFDERFQWSSVPTSMVWLADLAVMAGLLIIFLTLRENSYAAATVRVERDQPVITTGPYEWVRHPMYSGSMLAFLATPLALGSGWALVPAVLLCAAIVARLVDEESYLSGRLYGYKAYRREVPHRLIPHVW
jgi:protein-S-isoprenylcysteine O-methyltransferase Ste14